jgi:hypothetical protein
MTAFALSAAGWCIFEFGFANPSFLGFLGFVWPTIGCCCSLSRSMHHANNAATL